MTIVTKNARVTHMKKWFGWVFVRVGSDEAAIGRIFRLARRHDRHALPRALNDLVKLGEKILDVGLESGIEHNSQWVSSLAFKYKRKRADECTT